MKQSQVEQAATNSNSESNSIQRRRIEITSSVWKSLLSSSLVLSSEGRNMGDFLLPEECNLMHHFICV